jgi:hypothetical protein
LPVDAQGRRPPKAAVVTQEQTVAAVQHAVEGAETDLSKAIEGEADSAREKLTAEIDGARAELRALVRGLEEKIAERQRLQALKAWLGKPSRGFAPSSFGVRVPSPKKVNGEDTTLDEVIAALNAAFWEPAPPAPKPPAKPLQAVAR